MRMLSCIPVVCVCAWLQFMLVWCHVMDNSFGWSHFESFHIGSGWLYRRAISNCYISSSFWGRSFLFQTNWECVIGTRERVPTTISCLSRKSNSHTVLDLNHEHWLPESRRSQAHVFGTFSPAWNMPRSMLHLGHFHKFSKHLHQTNTGGIYPGNALIHVMKACLDNHLVHVYFDARTFSAHSRLEHWW